MVITIELSPQDVKATIDAGTLAAFCGTLIQTHEADVKTAEAFTAEAQKAQPVTSVAPAAPEPAQTVVPDTQPTSPVAPETLEAPQPAKTAPPIAPETTMPAVPTQSVSYTHDDLAKAGVKLIEQGKQKQLIALLAEFKVQSVPELPQEQLGAFALRLREMGAQI